MKPNTMNTMIDYIDVMANAIYIIRQENTSEAETKKLLREVEDDLFNLKHVVITQ